MMLFRALLCSVLLLLVTEAATSPAMAANDNTPPVHRVQSRLDRDAARFAMWYANPSEAWRGHLNRPDGWTLELFVVPGAGATDLEYQVDGTQLRGDVLPVFRYHGGFLSCAPQWPEAVTPIVGQAHAKFGLPYLAVDLPVGALEGSAIGAQYCLQLFSLVPVDTTELNIVVRFDLVGLYRGTIEKGRLTFASAMLPTEMPPTATPRTAVFPLDMPAPPSSVTKSWGSIKSLYR